MIWVILWLFLGTIWSWQALSEYFSFSQTSMPVEWQVFNIFLNTLLLPIGLIFGIFVFFVVRKVPNKQDAFDVDFMMMKLITKYEKKIQDKSN